MAKVTLRHLKKQFGKVAVIRDFDLEIHDREFMVLVGPSGCGKSTVLRMIAGLEEISGGEILIDDIVINDKPPKDRDMAMVFQSYALYPHMTVRENLEFGLKIRKTPQAEIDRRVDEAAEILGIEELLGRRPREMSGGQRQRVAVGRAIVRKPRVFLFDEPLSNLDAKLRAQMRAEISKLQRRLETTTVYVTHDQVEAMTMGHRIAIMKDGDLQQCGTPLEVYEQPRNLFVATFIGTPPMNFIRARFAEGGRLVDAGYLQLPVRAELHEKTRALDGQEVLVGIRPENLIEAARARAGETVSLQVEVEVVEPLGYEVLVHGRAGADLLVAKADPHRAPLVGGRLDLELELDAIHLFDLATERRITKEPS